NVDSSCVHVTVQADGTTPRHRVRVSALWGKTNEGNRTVYGHEAQTTSDNLAAQITIREPKLWSPEEPFLYDLRVQLLHNNALVDEVGSYFAMRKIAIGKDNQGVTRMLLNGRFLFQVGPLDQGFWPDGLYTAPTDEALKYDIEMTRKLGFNMTRKHVKV